MPSYSRTVQVPGRSSQELYEKVSADIDRFMEKTGIGKVDISRDAAQKKLEVKSSMFSAQLSCLDGSIHLDGKLTWLATPFKSKIDDAIDRWLAKTFV